MTLQQIASRLKDARFILAAAALAALIGFASGANAWTAAIGFALVVAACLLPRRSRSRRPGERRRIEEAARGDRIAQAVLIEALDVAAFLLDGAGAVVLANGAATALFGPVSNGIHLSSRIRSPGVLAMVREAIAGDRPASIEHLERVPSEHWYEVHAAPVHGPAGTGGQGGLFLLTFRDITQMRRMERMRTDFVANASHELRTPLASLTGFIETLQGAAKDDRAAQERFLAIMLEQVGRMSRLVEDLMALSRLEQRGRLAPAERVDLGPLIAHVRDTLRPLAAELDVEIRFEAPREPTFVIGARDELIQVFQNLVENACKYGQPGRFVDIAIDRPSDEAGAPAGMIDVAVRDYGAGIPPEHVPRLTERFYRVSVEASRTKKGTGLGLAIVKHILARHGGRLLVRSRLGEGSVFTARLPRAGDDVRSVRNSP